MLIYRAKIEYLLEIHKFIFGKKLKIHKFIF